jgi:hypothetical protein
MRVVGLADLFGSRDSGLEFSNDIQLCRENASKTHWVTLTPISFYSPRKGRPGLGNPTGLLVLVWAFPVTRAGSWVISKP